MQVDASQNPYPVRPTGYLVGSLLAVSRFLACAQLLADMFSVRPVRGAPLANLSLRGHLLGPLSDSHLRPLGVVLVHLPDHHNRRDRLEVLCRRDLTTQRLGRILVAAVCPGWFGESTRAARSLTRQIPLMAFTAQLFFGRRAWRLLGRPRWLAIGVVVLPAVTFAFGVA
jgi:hypothetical protein